MSQWHDHNNSTHTFSMHSIQHTTSFISLILSTWAFRTFFILFPYTFIVNNLLLTRKWYIYIINIHLYLIYTFGLQKGFVCERAGERETTSAINLWLLIVIAKARMRKNEITLAKATEWNSFCLWFFFSLSLNLCTIKMFARKNGFVVDFRRARTIFISGPVDVLVDGFCRMKFLDSNELMAANPFCARKPIYSRGKMHAWNFVSDIRSTIKKNRIVHTHKHHKETRIWCSNA